MQLLLTVITSGADSRESVREKLAAVEGFSGYHANISLSPTRVNSELFILQYRDGAITKLEEIRVKQR
jgi:hypothetical protein